MDKQCEIIKDLLPLYVDGACSEASGELVKAHLEFCPGCRACYEQMRSPAGEALLQKETCDVLRRHAREERLRVVKYLFLAGFLFYVPVLALLVFEGSTAGAFLSVSNVFVFFYLLIQTLPCYLAVAEAGSLAWSLLIGRRQTVGEKISRTLGVLLALAIFFVTAAKGDSAILLTLALGVGLTAVWVHRGFLYGEKGAWKEPLRDKLFWICVLALAVVILLVRSL